EREAKRGFAVVEQKRAGQFQSDFGFLARQDVPDADRKDPRAVLFSDRRAMSLDEGFGIVAARFFALAERSFDRPLTDAHLEARNGSPLRERKDIGGLERLAARGRRRTFGRARLGDRRLTRERIHERLADTDR